MSDTKIDIKGDDLDDGLDYDVDFSINEAGDVLDEQLEDLDEDIPEKVNNENPKKRKPTDSLKAKKKLKMEMDLNQKKQISTETSPEVIADYINSIVAQKNKKLSSLELSDLYISKADIRSTSEIEGPRNLDGLSKYLNTRFGNMLPKKKTENKDKKYIAIISMSAIRACDVHRATKSLGGGSLKLINKNKIDIDLKLLGATPSKVLCCTPGRLSKVLEHPDSVLKKDEIKILILDNSYLDKKGQNIWDIPESIRVIKELTASGSKVYLY